MKKIYTVEHRTFTFQHTKLDHQHSCIACHCIWIQSVSGLKLIHRRLAEQTWRGIEKLN